VTNRVGSTEQAERLLDFRASVSLDEGLRSVVEWRRQDQRAAAAT
jgi:UDP-glucose 4-epimerase